MAGSLLPLLVVAEEGEVVVVEARLHGQRALEKIHAISRSAEVEVRRSQRNIQREVHVLLQVDLENGLVQFPQGWRVFGRVSHIVQLFSLLLPSLLLLGLSHYYLRLSVDALEVGQAAEFLWYFDLSGPGGSVLDKLGIHFSLCFLPGVLFNLAEGLLLAAIFLHHLLEALLEDLLFALHGPLHASISLIDRVQLQNHLENPLIPAPL